VSAGALNRGQPVGLKLNRASQAAGARRTCEGGTELPSMVTEDEGLVAKGRVGVGRSPARSSARREGNGLAAHNVTASRPSQAASHELTSLQLRTDLLCEPPEQTAALCESSLEPSADGVRASAHASRRPEPGPAASSSSSNPGGTSDEDFIKPPHRPYTKRSRAGAWEGAGRTFWARVGLRKHQILLRSHRCRRLLLARLRQARPVDRLRFAHRPIATQRVFCSSSVY
jgi:hypothetical protein